MRLGMDFPWEGLDGPCWAVGAAGSTETTSVHWKPRLGSESLLVLMWSQCFSHTHGASPGFITDVSRV